VSIQPLVTVTLYRWPCCVQVGSELLLILLKVNQNLFLGLMLSMVVEDTL
jgi:hypothetical protein